MQHHLKLEQKMVESTFFSKGDLFEHEIAGYPILPTTVDWDNNGVPVLLIGAKDGHLYYLKNQQ